MAQKPVNIKISKDKLLVALKNALSDRKNALAEQKKDAEDLVKARTAWDKAIREHIKAGKATVKEVSYNAGWRGEDAHITVTLTVPASVPYPQEKEVSNYSSAYAIPHEVEELQNAIALLELSDEQMLSTSTYNGVARYIK